MRLLIIGSLEGQFSTAGKIAMDRGAKVAHVEDIELALAALRANLDALGVDGSRYSVRRGDARRWFGRFARDEGERKRRGKKDTVFLVRHWVSPEGELCLASVAQLAFGRRRWGLRRCRITLSEDSLNID